MIMTSMSGKAENCDVVIAGIAERYVHGVIDGGLGAFFIDKERRLHVRQTVSKERPESSSVTPCTGELANLEVLVSVYADERGADFHTVSLYAPRVTSSIRRCRTLKSGDRRAR